ncbi:MAG: hypothetical protein ACR2FK_07280 [Sphingomicrobium sp.]
MKLCIVIQSDAFRTSAGMRIRYDRFRECLADPGVSLAALTCAELVAAPSLDHDVYIFCKTFDTNALLLARRIRASGKVVGQDLFDDYFSQYDDPRLERFREWMRDMAPVTQFAICSTPRMVDVLRPYMPDIPITSIDDPIIGYDPLMVSALADAKASRARESRTLEVAWFGIGDNPYFPVGLTDLAASEPELARIEQLGWKVFLRIVTNRRAFEAGAAELLRRLSVDFEIVEWTEEEEHEALIRATVAILPVNGQSFSRAKSMNRAVTALSAGCQVLSLGFPLYSRLDEFLYRSADDLIGDIAGDGCRVSARTIDALTAQLATLANPFEAAASFVRDARNAMTASSRQPVATPLLCLIHGRSTSIGLHKLASALHGVSVGTMFSKAAWNFQVRFDVVANRMAMRVTLPIAKRFSLPLRRFGETIRIRELEFVEVDVAAMRIGPLAIHLPDDTNPIQDLAVYEDVMRFAQDCCRTAFAPADVLMSDSSPLHLRPREAVILPKVQAGGVASTEMPLAPVKEAVAADWVAGPWPNEVPKRKRRLFPVGAKTQRRQRAVALIEASPLFDSAWYLDTYPDVAASEVDPARHYHEFGWREGRDPGPGFSSKKYLNVHHDVAALDTNPLLHYFEHGEAEGRLIAASLNRGRHTAAATVKCG